MTTKKKRKGQPRTKWVRGDSSNKWVVCLGCFHEYFIESHELSPCCPVCESKEYEDSTPEKDYLDFDELGELL